MQKDIKKQILYVDMDGVIADFDHGIKSIFPDLETGINFPEYDKRKDIVDHICETNPDIFHNLKPIDDSIDYVKDLFNYYDLLFLSTPMWNVPNSYIGKRIWLHNHFGELAENKLILTKRKELNIGDYLVDDRLANGAGEFTGYHIHYGTDKFLNWKKVYNFLMEEYEQYLNVNYKQIYSIT